MTRREWSLLAALALLLVVGRADIASGASTVFGLLQITIGGVEQPGVGRLELPAGSTCDGDTCTVSGGSASNPAGCIKGAVTVAGSDNGEDSCNGNLVTIDVAGNILNAVGATVDGRDLSVDGTKLDGLPAQAVSQAQVSPSDASIVLGVYSGAAYGSGADAAVRVQACTVAIPNNASCRVRILWHGKQVGDAGTGLTPSAVGDMERVYHIRSGASGIAAVNVTTGINDNNNLTGTYALSSWDSGVFEPYVAGNGQPIWWTCYVLEQLCNTI